MAKKNISERELERLLETLSRRKNTTQGYLTKTEVFRILEEAGLLDVYEEGDLENLLIQKHKQISRLSIIVTIISVIFLSPLLLFGGYKLKEVSLSSNNSATQNIIENYEALTKNLKQENNNLGVQLEGIKDKSQKQEEKITQLNNKIADLQNRRASTSTTTTSSVLSAASERIINPGEIWFQGGMEIKVSNVSFKNNKGFVEFVVSIANRSGIDLTPDITGKDFYVTVNGRHFTNFEFNSGTDYDRDWYDRESSDDFSIVTLENGQKEDYYLVFSDEVDDLSQEIIFHVKEAGKIKNAQWRLNPEAN